MKVVSDELFNKIPLFYRLENLSFTKLRKLAYKKYGIMLPNAEGYDKYFLIDEILESVSKERSRVLERYKEVI